MAISLADICTMLSVRVRRREYGIALLAVAIAILVRMLMDPMLGGHLPFYIFYFAVMAAAAFAGAGPALVALVISFASAIFLFATPRYSLSISDQATAFNAFRFLTIGGTIALAGGWLRTRHMKWRHEMAERRQREADVQRTMERTYSTLASIGDGLITVDLEGRVTFMNAMAEEMSGWSQDEAMGRPIDKVFKLLDHEAGTPLENPALRSLREQAVITVPNGTHLVQRSGAQCPINDSASPIRDGEGTIIGSVIIFRGADATEGVHGFAVLGIHLHPANGSQLPLGEAQRKSLESACRKWLLREWRPDPRAVRFVALHGFDLIVRQESQEAISSGRSGLRFSVQYQQ